MAATISPTTTGSSAPYTITASKGVIADLRFNLGSTNPMSFAITYPTAAAPVVDLIGPSLTPHHVSTVPDGTTITDGNRQILVSKASAGGTDTLSCQITATAGAAVDVWHARMSTAAAATWTFQQTENTPGTPTITRLMCDPVSGFTLSSPDPPSPPTVPPLTAREKQTITMTGTAPAPATTVVGTPPPIAYCRWRVEASPPMPDFPDCGPVVAGGLPAKTVQMPGVYRDATFTLHQEVWFDAACPAPTAPPPGLLWSRSSEVVTIKTAPQHLMLVLDRSGSMASEGRWDNAVAGARLMIDLVAAIRPNVNAGDRVGVRIFEDPACTWGAKAVLPTNGNIGLSTPAAADAAMVGPPPHDFGPPGSCTPIGDALLAAMDDFVAADVADSPHFTIILMTDGIENSGATKVDPNISAAVQDFNTARTMLGRGEVSARLTIFAIGLGTFVQDQTLNKLPWPPYPFPNPISPKYRNVLKVGELADAIGQMVSFAMETRALAPLPAGPTPADPSPPAAARYFTTDGGVRIVAAAVLWTADATNVLRLEKRPAGTNGAYGAAAETFRQSPTHGFVYVDLGRASAATDWRITYERGEIAQTIADDKLLVYKDLQTVADARFDRLEYRTGQPIKIEVRARTGADTVSGLDVIVELARPGQSLGTFLVTHGTGWKPSQGGADPLSDKASMLQYALGKGDKGGLDILEPAGFFVDGTNELWEDKRPEAAGNYVNTYDGVDVEGTYTFRFYVHGPLADGSEFTQVMTHSVWVGVSADPNASIFTTATIGRDQLRVTVIPRDAGGQYLGPFWPTSIDFQTTGGTWLGPVVDNLDASYSRVLQLGPGSAPTVTPVVDGAPLPAVVVTTGFLGTLVAWLQRLCKRIVRFLLRLFGRKP